MSPARNPEAVKRLAAMVRELTDRDDFKHTMYYAHLIATLQEFHDRLAELERGSQQQREMYAAATKVFKAARAYASDHGFDHPNKVMAESGYSNPY
jgi:hypothetical protein